MEKGWVATLRKVVERIPTGSPFTSK